MRRRSFRTSRSARQLSRTFWIRNTGVFSLATAALPQNAFLFDPLQMNPSAPDLRADIDRSFTVLAQKFNFSAIMDTSISTGTSESIVAYFGIFQAGRTIANVSPSYSTAQDARTDWMANWMDTYFQANAGAPKRTVGQMTLGQANFRDAAQISIKSKRRLSGNDAIFLGGVFFGQLGTLTGTYNLTMQWSYSALLREG